MQRDMQIGLDRVRLSKKDLCLKIESNLKVHRDEYLAALAGWKQKVLQQMKENLSKAEAGTAWNTYISDIRPTDHSMEYERVKAMLQASVDDIVVLSALEFRQYWLDEWTWKAGHTEAVSNYASPR